MKIIGLGNYSRTGKDSLANAIVKHLEGSGLRVVKRSFAWKLKQICHELYSWDGMREPSWYDTPEGEKYRDIKLTTIGKTPVQIWVDFGTPAVREQVYQKTWIDYLLKSTDADVLIVPDVRFPNEVEAIKELGGLLVKVVRPGYGPRKTVADRALVGYTGWDWVVGAEGTMESLDRWGNYFSCILDPNFRMAFWRHTEAEKVEACKCEVIEPWEPPATAKKFTVELTEDEREALYNVLNVYEGVYNKVVDDIFVKLEA